MCALGDSMIQLGRFSIPIIFTRLDVFFFYSSSQANFYNHICEDDGDYN
jgi:hypothetical protein